MDGHMMHLPLAPQLPQLIIVVCSMRAPSHYEQLHTVLLRYLGLVLCELAWRHSCRRSPRGSSYARWRHLALPAFALGDVLLARSHNVVAGLEATLQPHQGPAYYCLLLVLSSRVLTNWLL